MRCSAAARAPPTSSTSIESWSASAVESTRTIGTPARRISSTSGWSSLRPIATTPSTIARLIARASEPCSGEMKWRRVAGLLGHGRHAFGERPEERVGEDHRQRLRRQDPDRQRLALGQHPRDRVRAVAQLIGHHPDPVGRLRRQSVGAVERERDGRLGDAGLAGDVGDARADRALFHGSPRLAARAVDLAGGPSTNPTRVDGDPEDEVIGDAATEAKTGLANRFSGP